MTNIIASILLMFNDVNDSWKNVNEKHDNYIASSETNDFTEADEWIGEIQERFYDVRPHKLETSVIRISVLCVQILIT